MDASPELQQFLEVRWELVYVDCNLVFGVCVSLLLVVYLGVRVCNVIVERGRRLLRVCCICVFSLVCVADPWTAEEDAG